MLTPGLIALCDRLPVPISIADPGEHDIPLIHVNPAFTHLTGWRREEIIGRNCRVLQGPLTDRTITDEMAHGLAEGRADVFTVLNYRRDGTPFVNIVGLRRFSVAPEQDLVIGCQMEYRSSQTETDLARHTEAIASAILLNRNGRPFARRPLETIELMRLDSLLMRFETAFIQVQCALLSSRSQLGDGGGPDGPSGTGSTRRIA